MRRLNKAQVAVLKLVRDRLDQKQMSTLVLESGGNSHESRTFWANLPGASPLTFQALVRRGLLLCEQGIFHTITEEGRKALEPKLHNTTEEPWLKQTLADAKRSWSHRPTWAKQQHDKPMSAILNPPNAKQEAEDLQLLRRFQDAKSAVTAAGIALANAREELKAAAKETARCPGMSREVRNQARREWAKLEGGELEGT